MANQDNQLINRTKLKELIVAVDEIFAWWNNSSGATQHFRGRDVKMINQKLFDGLNHLAMVGSQPNDAFHADARSLGLAITAFAKIWVDYCERAKSGDDVNPSGEPQLWSALDAVRKAMQPLQLRSPEPVRQLIEREKVEAWQVAKIYGWKDATGQPDVRKVQEELEKPGTHYDAKTWVHPDQVRFDAEVAEKWATRIPATAITSMDDIEEQAAAASRQDAPESMDLLIQQRVPISQICLMKGVDVETVERRAGELGVVLADARNLYPATQGVAIMNKLEQDEKDLLQYEADQKKQAAERKQLIAARMTELKSAGKSKEEITATIEQEFPA